MLEPQSDEINLIPFFMASILVTFLVTITKYHTRSNLRKKRFVLTFCLRGTGTLWWGRCGSRWLYDLGAYNSLSHHIYSQETDRRECWFSAGLLIFLFSLSESVVIRRKRVNPLSNSSLETFSQKYPKVCTLRNLKSIWVDTNNQPCIVIVLSSWLDNRGSFYIPLRFCTRLTYNNSWWLKFNHSSLHLSENGCLK